MATAWMKGRGRMGPMAPLIGRWKAMAASPTGLVACVGDYQKPSDLYVRLDAEWRFKGKQTEMKSYREVCIFGPGPDGVRTF